MLLTVLIALLPPLSLLKGLRHWSYGLHVAMVALVAWIRFPGMEYPLWHPYYPYFLGAAHLISISCITFAAYGWDKRQAKYGGWRVPEKTLHALAFMGGTLGALAGSKFFRHKTIKGQFRQMFYLVAGAQVFLIVMVLWIL